MSVKDYSFFIIIISFVWKTSFFIIETTSFGVNCSPSSGYLKWKKLKHKKNKTLLKKKKKKIHKILKKKKKR